MFESICEFADHANVTTPMTHYVFDHGSESMRSLRVLITEDDGVYVAQAIRLPGVVSQGDTVDEAIRNVTDAFRETIRYYAENHLSIPWDCDEPDRSPKSSEKWLLVEVNDQ